MQSGEFERMRSDAREAAELVEQALTEACAASPVHEADTGELIRVEEMLAVASDAARRAIALKRKARQEEAPQTVEGLPLAGSDQGAASPHRAFTDARGVTWDVWAVYPEGRRPSQLSALPGSFQTGWLVFESLREKRRLSPIPSGWSALSPEALEQLCDKASAATRRARPTRREDGDTTPAGE